MTDDERIRRAVLKQSWSVGLATGFYGAGFGAVSVAAGFSVAQTCVLSLLLFSGASQFAIAGIAAAGGGMPAAVATSTLLGARNMFYGLHLAATIPWRGWRRLAYAQVTIDESTAVGIGQREAWAARLGFRATGLIVYVGWNLMTLVGALLGQAVADPKAWGLDAAAAAAFVALLWPRLRQRDGRAIAAVAALVALLAAPHWPAGVPVLVAGAVAGVLALAMPGAGEADGTARRQAGRR